MSYNSKQPYDALVDEGPSTCAVVSASKASGIFGKTADPLSVIGGWVGVAFVGFEVSSTGGRTERISEKHPRRVVQVPSFPSFPLMVLLVHLCKLHKHVISGLCNLETVDLTAIKTP